MNRPLKSLPLCVTVVFCVLHVVMLHAQVDETPSKVSANTLMNLPERNEEFMDWGLGMFVHWSLDSQLGSVISHSMVGATDEYLERYINDLPKTFNPKRYDSGRMDGDRESGGREVHSVHDQTSQWFLYVGHQDDRLQYYEYAVRQRYRMRLRRRVP